MKKPALEHEGLQENPTKINPLDLAVRTVIFAALWWILAGDDSGSWLMGVPVVLLATISSLAVMPTNQWNARPVGAVLFLAYFLSNSLISSFDVARRVFSPSIPLHPAIIEYPFRLKNTNARVIMANTASLLPGTLSVDLHDDFLKLHILDQTMPVMESLRQLETRIAGMYGIRFIEGETG